MKTLHNLKKMLDKQLIATYVKLHSFGHQAKVKLAEDKGDFAMDHGVVTVICVALGAILLALLIAYFKGAFSSNITSKINDFFSQG
jgi:hypothetical protein